MAEQPPRKRQWRLIVESSDDDDDDDEYKDGNGNGNGNGNGDGDAVRSESPPRRKSSGTSRTRTRSGVGVRQTQTTLPVQYSPKRAKTKMKTRGAASTTPTPTPTPSPEKRRKTKIHTTKEQDGKNNLRAWFQPATEEQRWDRDRDQEQRTLEGGNQGGSGGGGFGWEDEDDSIEDDGVDEIFAGLVSSGAGNGIGTGNGNGDGNGIRENTIDKRTKPIAPGRKFLLPTSTSTSTSRRAPGFGSGSGVVTNASAATSSTAPPNKTPTRPWPEEFAPANLEELAVHKRKVADVQSWLAEVFSGRNRRRILVLRGPAGSGKSTTVSLLSKTLGYDVIEWRNSAGSEYSSQGYVSMGAQFDDFLGRTDKFNTLDLGNEQQGSQANGQRRVILVEEFPTSLAPGSSGLLTFRAAIQRHLAATVPLRIDKRSPSASPPVIIVVSETLLTSSGSFAGNFTVHRLLGPEISNHPGVSIIEFNPVAPTFVSKALGLVLKKEARRSNRKRVPGPAVLKQISEMGDIRSAISSLEFMCLRGDGGKDGWSGTLATQKRKTGKPNIQATAMEKESLEMVTQREASLGIFHAVGKVMYNKREDPAESAQPPPHLREHARPKPSQVSIDDLINETGTDIQTFISALHENYVLSCSGPAFTDTLDSCISSLSDADILSPGSRRGYRTSRAVGTARPFFPGGTGSVDVLRQEEISFQTAVRGLLFSLPHPVKRSAVPGGRKRDEHKMFYPTSLRLWRENEEIEGLLDIWIRRLTSSSTLSERKARPGGVESWQNRFAMAMSMPDADEVDPTSTSRAMISRDEVLLERLPYLSRISSDAAELGQLEKLTKFNGIAGPSDDLDDDDGEDVDIRAVAEHWATDRPPASPRKRRPGRAVDEDAEEVEDAVDRMVLSDDDIED